MAVINWDKKNNNTGPFSFEWGVRRGEDDFDFKQVKLVLPGEHLGGHVG